MSVLSERFIFLNKLFWGNRLFTKRCITIDKK